MIGGVVFGVGFVMTGLCPGTACVSVFTGKLDALAVFAGMFAGLFLFAELEPKLEGILSYSSIGDISLYELFNMEYGILTFVIILVALAAFWFVGKVEERIGRKTA